ncbi:hypothetical protein [Salinicola halophyticus]|uniref:hypothetical protein n=1 Tax=Salinicola halophyticus TaxID=1808881 RepID=UPI003F46E145
MLKFTAGLILGVAVGLSGVYTYYCLGFEFDLSHATNITIAVATLFAVSIHFDAQRTAKKNRIWDTNKEMLLDLVHSLSKAMNATDIEIENELKHQAGQGSTELSEREISSFDGLDRKIDYVLSVYSPLMDSKLVADIETFKSESDEFTREALNDEISNLEAYEEILGKYKSLCGKLIKFVGRVSGIKYT